MKKQILLFIFALLPMTAWADETGKCGDHLTWTYVESTKTLTISGIGAMQDYDPFGHYAPWRSYISTIQSVIIEEGVTSIGESAFSECINLTSITIPNSVTTIGQNAFLDCTSLRSITIPNSVTSIGGGAFRDCSRLTSAIIGNGVTAISTAAFAGCSGLTSITIPNSVTSIGDGAFENCYSLTSITIPNSVTSIGNSAFSECRGLTSITIPNSVTSIGNYAFYGCSGLTSVTFLDSVTSIGDYAFSDCNNLSRVISLATNPWILSASNIFPDFFKTSGLLYIPAGTRLAYIEKGWNKYFGNIIEMEEGEPIWLTIKDAEQGQSQLKCEAGKSYTLRFKASKSWRIHSVSFKGADVTSWLSVDGEFTTPAMSASTELIVTYEQIATSVKAELNAEDDMRVVVINDEIVVKNAAPGTPIRIFDLSGKLIGSATATEGITKVETAMSDKVVIVKVGERSVKVAR